MVKRLRHGGQNQNFLYQIWLKDYVTGVKSLRNQTYAYHEYGGEDLIHVIALQCIGDKNNLRLQMPKFKT